jgi:hypothetical protein
MRQMTLRDIPEEVEMAARNEASRQGISLNKAFLTLLRKSTQQNITRISSAEKKQKSRFSRFCGIWSDAEAAEFDKALLEQRTIDNETWQ